jgi:hypothetical protein
MARWSSEVLRELVGKKKETKSRGDAGGGARRGGWS